MTREEAIEFGNMWLQLNEDCQDSNTYAFFKMAIKALEQEPYDFAKWVATEIFDENWEYNKNAFAELACRRLAKMGIVRAKGDEWELVESMESEG